MKRVLLLLDQRANASLLAEYLSGRYEVIVGTGAELTATDFDLGVVDGPTVDRLGDSLRQRREQDRPVLLPFLFVTSRQDIGLATRHLWNTVDELILAPIQKLELHARVEVLLRSRDQSLLNHRILSAAGQGILGIGPDGTITLANSMAHLLLGYPTSQLVGQPVRGLIHGDEPAATAADSESLIDLALRTGSIASEYSGRFRQHDGSVLPTDFIVTPIEPGNAEEGAVLVFSDLTELQRLNESLEQKVAERTAELTAANAELESFSYSVSHDLRGPLRTVNGFSQALLDDYGSRLDQQGRDYIERIIAATGRMGAIIDSLLRLSRVTRSELVRHRVDISQVASAVGREMERRHPGRKVDFRVAEGLAAEADARLVETVLEDLLDNAWKYTARTAAPVVEVGAVLTEGGKAFFVRDNGIGFDPQYSDRLFRPFEKIHLGAEFGGYGVGLAIVHRIISRHGGRIWAEGAVGRGATFYFTLEPQPEL